MKGKLIKDEDGYSLFTREENSTNRKFIATTQGIYVDHKLSKQNCDEVFGVVNVENLADEIIINHLTEGNPDGDFKKSTIGAEDNKNWFKIGFNRAMELNKDKLFTIEDIANTINKAREGIVITRISEWETEKEFEYTESEIIQSLQQPTEIEVEIVMECLDPNCDGINKKGVCITTGKPKLDKEGCLILKKL
jgi:hypothetical protein